MFERSYSIEKVAAEKRGEVFSWLDKHQLSAQFSASSGSFEYVHFDKEEAASFQKTFPEARLTHSAPSLAILW